MADLEEQAQPAVNQLLGANEGELYAELGKRVMAIRKDPTLREDFNPPIVGSMGPAEDLTAFGKRYWERFQSATYNLMCGNDKENAEARDQISHAFGTGETAVAAALAAAIVTYVGLAPAIAAVLAALAIHLFFQPAYGAMCDVWKSKLPQTSS